MPSITRSDAFHTPYGRHSLLSWKASPSLVEGIRTARGRHPYKRTPRFAMPRWQNGCSDLEVEAGALDGVGAHLAIGDGDVLGMDGVALQGLFALEGAVEHHVGIG